MKIANEIVWNALRKAAAAWVYSQNIFAKLWSAPVLFLCFSHVLPQMVSCPKSLTYLDYDFLDTKSFLIVTEKFVYFNSLRSLFTICDNFVYKKLGVALDC